MLTLVLHLFLCIQRLSVIGIVSLILSPFAALLCNTELPSVGQLSEPMFAAGLCSAHLASFETTPHLICKLKSTWSNSMILAGRSTLYQTGYTRSDLTDMGSSNICNVTCNHYDQYANQLSAKDFAPQ